MGIKQSETLDNCYLIPNRLSDVIRLIIVLSVDKQNFRKEEGLTGTLRDTPKSGDSWLEIAKDHPEFFRFGKDKLSIVLLIRFILMKDVEDGELRPPLSVDQTQKLVDQAISLHDKQLARYQRNSFKTAIWAAYIAAAATLIAGVISYAIAIHSNQDFKTDIEIIKSKLETMEKRR